ncbi:cell envelope integrity TolA C-terminal domain-containing protein [Atlantibacter hermannii]|uniref:cell envelope integrity TolA C-terminal domain-containing protein n=1 Tax=Atlantibacter hermannii TaxID=565 RepID=UPI0028ACB8D8|nr:cell envelope integrity TolA C-terminal domain-containing protein [Atlantibacter hermannii]
MVPCSLGVADGEAGKPFNPNIPLMQFSDVEKQLYQRGYDEGAKQPKQAKPATDKKAATAAKKDAEVNKAKAFEEQQRKNQYAEYNNKMRGAIGSNFQYIESMEGKRCTMKIKLSRDAKLVEAYPTGGDPVVCDAAFRAVKFSAFPKFPNDEIYKDFQSFTIDFQ